MQPIVEQVFKYMNIWQTLLIQNTTSCSVNVVSNHYQIQSHKQTDTLMHPFCNTRDDDGHDSPKRSNMIWFKIEMRKMLGQPQIGGRQMI